MDDIKPVDLQEPLADLARDPTRFAHDLQFPPSEKIRIYDDTLRDGEQMRIFSDRKSTRLNSSHRT